MEQQLREMGQRLADLREIKDITIAEMANKLEMPVEEYLAYEEGKNDFSFSFMVNVATILGVEVSCLLSGNAPTLNDCAVVRKGQEFFIKKEGVYDYKYLGFTFKDKKADPFFVQCMPGEEDVDLHSHKGQEFNFVLSGKMILKVGERTYELNKGDSVYFNSDLPHGIKVLGDTPVKFLAVVIR